MEVLPNSPRKNLKTQKILKFFPAYPIRNSLDGSIDHKIKLSNLPQYLHNHSNSRITINHSKTYLPPLETRSSSKEINLSLDHSEAKQSIITLKPKQLNPAHILQSSSEKLIRRTKLTYLPKLEENHDFDIHLRRYSNDSTEIITPTFRNISCQNSSSTNTSRKELKTLKPENEKTMIFPISEKKLLEKESRFKNLIGVFPQSKAVKKIKVLHHKFPKDMFLNGNLSNS
jgi:hypothetical protein